MLDSNTGKIVGVNGNLLTVEFDTYVTQNEVAYAVIGAERLKAEVIRVRGKRADLQVFEDTRGIKVGNQIDFTDQLLGVELGPGILTGVYDGLQNPLNDLAEQTGFFLKRGLYLKALDHEKEWEFTPAVKKGEKLIAGDKVGSVPEGIFEHYIMLPFGFKEIWEVTEIADKGEYKISETVAKVVNEKGEEREITMVQEWPVKVPINAYREKILPTEPMITRQRIIDTFFPVSSGGTFCIPGPFGAGKTVLQHALSRYAEADIVIVAACGERAGEVVEILREFPHLEDPQTGRTLMERSVIICNTSSMPVAAREASVYTAVTIAEYYRQMGLNALLLADSTSRWAQALREMSGRLEEIPGEEAFPAYLESLVAGFYERAGLVELNDGKKGSVTIGGTVSPAGGNFEEPVTQATLKVVGAFLGLSRDRSNARRFPAIHPLESWSKYPSIVEQEQLEKAVDFLRRGNEVNQMMKVVGEEGTHINDFQVYIKSEFLDAVYLQQNTFDKVDAATDDLRQKYVFNKVLGTMGAEYGFESKDDARRFFQEMRQLFIDWNYSEYEGEEFKKLEKQIDEKIAGQTGGEKPESKPGPAENELNEEE